MKNIIFKLNPDVSYDALKSYLLSLQLEALSGGEVKPHEVQDLLLVTYGIEHASRLNAMETVRYEYDVVTHSVSVVDKVQLGDVYDCLHNVLIEKIALRFSGGFVWVDDQKIDIEKSGIYHNVVLGTMHDYLEVYRAQRHGLFAAINNMMSIVEEKSTEWTSTPCNF